MTVVWIVLGLGAMMAVLLGAVAIVVRTARARLEEARQAYPDARHVEPAALFFGQESRGATQMRGNGTLVFDTEEVVFRQWVVDRVFRVPYRAIQAVETPRSFLGKSQGVQLLKIRYRTDDGAEDSMAWRVRDLDGSMRAIEAGRG